MACDYIYKGQTFTRGQLEDYIRSNPQEFLNRTEVVDSQGNITSVLQEEIITYPTDVGNINYIKDSKGDLVKVSLLEPYIEEEISGEDSLFEAEEATQAAYPKYVQFKEAQVSILRQRLNNIKTLKREHKSDEQTIKDLNQIEFEIKLRLEGSEEKNIKGLIQEIEDLKKNPTISAIGYYVERDLSRLENLINSTNPSDLDEAQGIIDFYIQSGTFIKNIINPFFTDSEMFFESGKPRLQDSVMNTFREWKERAEYFKSILDAQRQKTTTDIVNSNYKVQKITGSKGLDFSEIVHQKEGLKDLNWIDMWVMDTTSGIFSHNGLLPQVMMDYLKQRFEEKAKWSKDIERKINDILPRVEKTLSDMGYGFKALGIFNVTGVSYDLFKQVDKYGRETGRLAHRYSKEFFDARSNMENEFRLRLDNAQEVEDLNRKNDLYQRAFEYKKNWYLNNVVVLDINRLPEVISNPEFSSFKGSFKSTEEAEAYKKRVIDIIGEVGYKEEVEKQIEQIKAYQINYTTYVENIMNEAGVNRMEDLSSRDKAVINFWEAQHSPFKGVEDYYSNKGIKVGDNRVHNYMSHNISFPRKNPVKITTKDGGYQFDNINRDLGYYDKNYETIENNSILKEFYDIMSGVTKTIRDVLPPEMQDKMTVNNVPALKKNILEILSDGNIPFFKRLSAAVKELYDRLIQGIRVVEQDQISTATVDSITGLPKYSVNTSFLQGNSQEINRIFNIEKARFNQIYSLTKDKKDPIKNVFVKDLNQGSINLMADYLGVQPTSEAIRARVGELINVNKVIKDFATHSVVQQQSFDLPKIAKFFSHVAMEYAARQEALPVMKIMKDHYNQIKSPSMNNVGDSIINRNGDTRLEGLRTRANAQMEDWWERVVLNNYDIKHSGVIAAIGKKTPKTLGEKTKKLAESLTGAGLKSKKYTLREKEMLKDIDSIIEKETDEVTIKKLKQLRSDLGGNVSATSAFDALLKFIRLKGLGWNISSQLTNLAEGTVANMIIASSGDYFEPHLIYEAYNVVKGSVLKSASFNLVETKGAKKARNLIDRYKIIQDASNELQKASVKTNFSWTSKLSPYELIRRVEYVNQAPLMIAMLKHLKVDDGKTSVWDAMDENGRLREPYRTQENINNWEEASGNEYKNFKTTLSKAIVVAHGNYDDKRGMMAKSTLLGKALLMFKTWITSAFYQRFATTQDDLESGITGYYGRYRSHTPVTGFVQGAVAGTFFFGPVGALIGGTIGSALSHAYGRNTGRGFGKGFLYEVVDTSKALTKKFFGMPINMIVGRNVINTNTDFSHLIGKGNFTERDARNMRANMAELATLLTWMIFVLIAKSMFSEDDEEEEAMHNLLVNRFMGLAEQATMYTNPRTLQENVLDISIMKFFEDLYKEGVALHKYLMGDDILSSGINSGESRLWTQTQRTFMPGIFRDGVLGFGSQTERVFEPPIINSWFEDDIDIERRIMKGERAARRKQLLEEGMDKKEAEKIVNQELPMPQKPE